MRFFGNRGVIAVCRAAMAGVCLVALDCSKTQDTTPESRLFGQPPIFDSVNVTVNGASTVQCDLTKPVQALLCASGIQPTDYSFNGGGGLTETVTYTEVDFDIIAHDPQDTPTKSDILLVTSSFVAPDITTGSPEEISLLVLDDGSTNQFNYSQSYVFLPLDESCTTDPCSCSGAATEIKLSTNDAVANDKHYTRHFAFTTNGGPGGTLIDASALGLVQDCVAMARGQFPFAGRDSSGLTYTFKIEAVDRSGNIATWPQKPSALIQPPTWRTSDECASCILSHADASCHNKIGLIGPSFPNGVCNAIF